MRFEFAERLLDRIEIRRIFGKVTQSGTYRFNHLSHTGNLVYREAIHHHEAPRAVSVRPIVTDHGPCFFTGSLATKKHSAAPFRAQHRGPPFLRPQGRRLPRSFFEADIVPLEEPPNRDAAAGDPPLVHRRDDLIQRQIRLLGNQRQQNVRVRLQRRDAASALAAMLPVSFKRCIHLIAELALTSTHSAASRRDAPASTSRSTRIRKSSEQGLGIDPLQKWNQCR